MPAEQKTINKPYLLLCEGKDAERFLIHYLNSEAVAHDKRLYNDIQVFDFGGNEELKNGLMFLKNMDNFDQVTSIAVIRDAEKDYTKACLEVCNSFRRCGFAFPNDCGTWAYDHSGLKVGYTLFPLNNSAGTLEDLCVRILSERNNKDIMSSIDAFLGMMESSYGRKYNHKHKNKLHMYLSSSEKYVTMPLGLASRAGAFDWGSDELEPLKTFLINGFYTAPEK